MNTYIRNLIIYFENVLHPASGWDSNAEKRKRKMHKHIGSRHASPECYNVRGISLKKEDKLRRNPAP